MDWIRSLVVGATLVAGGIVGGLLIVTTSVFELRGKRSERQNDTQAYDSVDAVLHDDRNELERTAHDDAASPVSCICHTVACLLPPDLGNRIPGARHERIWVALEGLLHGVLQLSLRP